MPATFAPSPSVPSVFSTGRLPITDAIGRDVWCNKFALNVRPASRRLPGALYQSARAAHVIDDVISHDDDDVINYVRPADTGKSIVTTDIRRAGWASGGDRRAVAARCRRRRRRVFPNSRRRRRRTDQKVAAPVGTPRPPSHVTAAKND